MEKSISKQNFSKIALKNSFYGLASGMLIKFGGLILTIIIARILLPELFGIYALALSIITLFMIFTNLGTNETFLRYFSEALGKKKYKKARTYLRYLLKIKFVLIFATIILLFLSSRFLAYNFYEKPLLFYPLIFSCLFILTESLKNFVGSIFIATKNMKPVPLLEILHQATKISFSVLAVFTLSFSFRVAGLMIAFAFAGLIHIFFLTLISYKKNKEFFIGSKVKIDKKRIKKYLGFMSMASISLVLFVSIDMLMLGKFVDAEYIGYYRIALSLILTVTSILSLSRVFLPIFTQIHKNRFKRGFQKTFRFLMLIAIPASVGIIFIGKHLIFTIYGKEYLLAASSLYFLSVLIITAPLTNLYLVVLQSKERTKILAKSVTISLLINIILNYVLIKYLINFSQEHVIIGVGIATVVSRLVFLLILSINARQKLNLRVKGIGLKSPLFATLIMALFLLAFNNFIDMNLFYGAIEIIVGIGIYFGVLFLTKGATKEDWKLIKSLIKK